MSLINSLTSLHSSGKKEVAGACAASCAAASCVLPPRVPRGRQVSGLMLHERQRGYRRREARFRASDTAGGGDGGGECGDCGEPPKSGDMALPPSTSCRAALYKSVPFCFLQGGADRPKGLEHLDIVLCQRLEHLDST